MKLIDVEHIYFDLDHTLWDFDKNSALAFKHIFKSRSITLTIENFLEAYTPINYRYWELYRDNMVSKEVLRFGRLKDSFDALKFETSDDTINLIADDYIKHLPENNHLLDGSKELLEYLKPKYKLHIITNGFEEVQHTKMNNAGILEYFETITTSEEAGVKKPNALIFQKALEKSNARPDKSVMVGDNYIADIRGAENYGLRTIYFDYYKKGEVKPAIQVEHLSEINRYL